MGGILMILGSLASVLVLSWVFLPEIASNPGGVDAPIVVFLVIMGIFLAPLVALSIIGGVAAIRRRDYRMALIGGVCSIICSTFIGAIALVLVVRSKDDFDRPNQRNVPLSRNWPKV